MVTAERQEERRVVALDFGRRARRDALPEHTQYADTGCDVHPSCLTCPLVRCRYDEPGGVRKVFSEGRDRAIVGMQREGVPVGAIARRFGVSRRTVFRALARARTPPPNRLPPSTQLRTGAGGKGAPFEPSVAARWG
jgi:hypothetical protein